MLREFYAGRFKFPWERPTPPRCDRYKELVDLIQAETKYFTDKMDEADLERWNALNVLHSELDGFSEGDLFAYSFSMGFMCAADVIREAEAFSDDGDEE